jgi:hypothetical protein
MVTERTRNRAQMILLGAIALAVLIVGVSIVVNSLTTTRTAAPSQASPQIDEAREFGFESRKGTRSLVLRINHRYRNVTATELGTQVRENVTRYSQLLAESYASSHSEYVSISYHDSDSAYGERLVQAGDDNLTATDNPTDFVPSGQRRALGWFVLNADVEETGREQARITVSNGTESIEFRINSTSGGNLNVTSDVSYDGTTTVTCDPSSERVLLDLVDGRSFTADCQFDGIRTIEGPYSVEVRSEELVGKYELVYNESVTTSPSVCTDSDPRTEQCTVPAVWVANVTARLDSSELSFSNDYNVSIYGATP